MNARKTAPRVGNCGALAYSPQDTYYYFTYVVYTYIKPAITFTIYKHRCMPRSMQRRGRVTMNDDNNMKG